MFGNWITAHQHTQRMLELKEAMHADEKAAWEAERDNLRSQLAVKEETHHVLEDKVSTHAREQVDWEEEKIFLKEALSVASQTERIMKEQMETLYSKLTVTEKARDRLSCDCKRLQSELFVEEKPDLGELDTYSYEELHALLRARRQHFQRVLPKWHRAMDIQNNMDDCRLQIRSLLDQIVKLEKAEEEDSKKESKLCAVCLTQPITHATVERNTLQP